jgi:hypothetical protein
MFNQPNPAPRYWKALVVTTVFLVPMALVFRAFAHMPDAVWAVLSIGAALVIAWGVHARMQNDWRASGTMAARTFDSRTTVARNVQIKER